MERVGFGIFGRPVKHEYISNGLFQSLQLESETYLNLPNRAKLDENDRVIKISREVIETYNIEVIKVYIYDYAVSVNKREGGFVGSAYVFTGLPTKDLLYNAVKEIHSKALSLLDENRQFKSLKIDIDINQLISPNSSGLIYGDPIISNDQLDTTSKVLHTDGPVIDYLISVVQGFIYNPDYKSLQTLYVSDNKDLLRSILNGSNDNKIFGIGHILNFHTHFETWNNAVIEKYNDYNTLQKKIDNEERERRKKIDDDLATKIAEIENIQQDIGAKTSNLNNLKSQVSEEKGKLKNTIEEISTKIESLNTLEKNTFNKFEELLENEAFAQEKEEYLNKHSDIIKLKEDNKKLKKKNDKLNSKNDETNFIKKIIKLVIIFSLVFSIIGLGVGYLLWGLSNKGTDHKQSTGSNYTETEQDTYNNNNQVLENHDLIQFLDKTPDEQNIHKKQIDSLLQKIIDNNYPSQDDSVINLVLKKRWNFAELIENDEISTDRIDNILKIYNEKGNTDTFFFGRGLLLFNSSDNKTIEYEEKPFRTQRHDTIFEKYIEIEEHVYQSYDEDKIKNHKNVFMIHFNWMMKNNSVSNTTGTNFEVPLINN